VKLNQNEAPEDWPEALKQSALKAFGAIPFQRYPRFDPGPWQALLARHTGWRGDGVLIGNGSNELLTLLFRAVVRPGDRVVLPVPCFSLYPLHLDVAGARLDRITAGPDYALDVDGILRAARGARLVVLASPNNPTGAVLPKDALPALLETGALIAVDEAYAEFAGQDFAPFLGEDVPLVLFRTFSKARAAAALRFGFMLGPPAICAELFKVTLPYDVSAVTLAAVEMLLDQPELLQVRIEHVRRERQRLASVLAGLGVPPVPSGANFLLFPTAPLEPGALFRRLLERGVLVRDASSACPGHLRVSVGTPEDNDAFLTALRAELAGDEQPLPGSERSSP
jgi:histidinol-phosphate aminotransferase